MVVHPSVSFLDLAFARLGVDPVAAGVRIVDAERFAVDAAGERGPLLVAQCWSRQVLSDVKLSVEVPPDDAGDRPAPPGPARRAGASRCAGRTSTGRFEPDHLTSLWMPRLAAPVAAELVALDELVHTLRERCPWDRRQTHASLGRHLLEESYEVLEAIDAVAAVDAGPGDRARRRGRPTGRPRPSPTSRRSSATCCSRCTSTPPWPPRRGGSPWPTWPGGSTTSWCPATPTSSATSPPRHGRRRGRQLGGHQEGGEGPRPASPRASRPPCPPWPWRPSCSARPRPSAWCCPAWPTRRPGGRRRRPSGWPSGGPMTPRWPTAKAAPGPGPTRSGELLFAAVGLARALGVDPETALLSRSVPSASEVEARG